MTPAAATISALSATAPPRPWEQQGAAAHGLASTSYGTSYGNSYGGGPMYSRCECDVCSWLRCWQPALGGIQLHRFACVLCCSPSLFPPMHQALWQRHVRWRLRQQHVWRGLWREHVRRWHVWPARLGRNHVWLRYAPLTGCWGQLHLGVNLPAGFACSDGVASLQQQRRLQSHLSAHTCPHTLGSIPALAAAGYGSYGGGPYGGGMFGGGMYGPGQMGALLQQQKCLTEGELRI